MNSQSFLLRTRSIGESKRELRTYVLPSSLELLEVAQYFSVQLNLGHCPPASRKHRHPRPPYFQDGNPNGVPLYVTQSFSNVNEHLDANRLPILNFTCCEPQAATKAFTFDDITLTVSKQIP